MPEPGQCHARTAPARCRAGQTLQFAGGEIVELEGDERADHRHQAGGQHSASGGFALRARQARAAAPDKESHRAEIAKMGWMDGPVEEAACRQQPSPARACGQDREDQYDKRQEGEELERGEQHGVTPRAALSRLRRPRASPPAPDRSGCAALRTR